MPKARAAKEQANSKLRRNIKKEKVLTKASRSSCGGSVSKPRKEKEAKPIPPTKKEIELTVNAPGGKTKLD